MKISRDNKKSIHGNLTIQDKNNPPQKRKKKLENVIQKTALKVTAPVIQLQLSFQH